jgi:flagellar assembly protein FliH
MSTMLRFRARSAEHVLFAEDFEEDGTVIEVPPEPEITEPHFSAADLESARRASWEEGRLAGHAEAEAGQSALVARSLAAIAEALRNAEKEAQAVAEEAADAISRLVMECLATALPALCADYGEGEVRALMQIVMPGLEQQPDIAIRVHPHLLGPVQQELGRFDPDLRARVRLVPTDAMAAGDVRIAWQDGYAQRDAGRLRDEISEILASAEFLPRASNKEKVKELAYGR